MAQPPDVTPDYFEILVVRELRKAGLEVTEPRVHRRTELPEPERGFLLELLVWLGRNTWQKRALIACRRQVGAIGAEAVETLTPHLAEAQAEVGLLFATAPFTPQGLAAGDEQGLALVQLVDRVPAGQPRSRLLEAGQADIILERLRARGGVP